MLWAKRQSQLLAIYTEVGLYWKQHSKAELAERLALTWMDYLQRITAQDQDKK